MSKLPEPRRTLTGEIRKDRAKARRSFNSSPFFGTGMHPNGDGGLDLDGTLNVDGAIVARSGEARSGNFVADVSGWRFSPDGNMDVNDINLRGGIVGNDALANPVIPGSVWQEAANFTVSPSWNTVINFNATVPAGVTSAEIDARARVTAFYNNAGTGSGVDYLYAILYVGAYDSDFYPLAVTDNGGSGTNQVFRSAVLTGLTPGGSVNFQVQTSSDFATWSAPSSPGNKAKLGASIRWYR